MGVVFIGDGHNLRCLQRRDSSLKWMIPIHLRLIHSKRGSAMSTNNIDVSHSFVFRRPLITYLTELSLLLIAVGVLGQLLDHQPYLFWGVGLAVSMIAARLARSYAAGVVVLTKHEIIVRYGTFFLIEQRLSRTRATAQICPAISLMSCDSGRVLLTIDGVQHCTPTIMHARVLVMAIQCEWPFSNSHDYSDVQYQRPTIEPEHIDQSFARLAGEKTLLGPFAMSTLYTNMSVPQTEDMGTSRLEKVSEQTYDVFLSYHAPDREAATSIRARLQEAGLRSWFDQDEILPGQQWMERVEAGLARSRAIVVIIGPRGLGRWQRHETSVSIRLAAGTMGTIPVIPVLLPGADRHSLPLLLDNFSWVEFHETMEDEVALTRLITGIVSAHSSTKLGVLGCSND